MSYEIIETPMPALDLQRYELRVHGVVMAVLTQTTQGPPQLAWTVYGPQHWPDAKELLLGLLELSVHADRLSQQPRGAIHAQGKKGRR